MRQDWSTNPSLALPVVAFTTLLWVTSMLYVSKRTRDATLEDVGLTVGDQKLMKTINEHGMEISNQEVARKVEELSRHLKTPELSEG